MEKDNKYYSVIENLIRNHKKYNGYDAIIEDIIEDVYKHSKSVIGSVKDDDVIMSYLQKIVAISIITVPKRLNFHAELNHRTISVGVKPEPQPVKTSVPETNFDIQREDTVENVQKANVEFVDRMINSIDSSSVLENSSTDIQQENDDTVFEELQILEEPVETIITEDEPANTDSNLEELTIYNESDVTESSQGDIFSETEQIEPEPVQETLEEVFDSSETVDIQPDTEEMFVSDESAKSEPAEEETFIADEPVDLEPAAEEIFASNEPAELEPATIDEPISLDTAQEDIFADNEQEMLEPQWEDTNEIMLQDVDNDIELNISDENSDNNFDVITSENDSFDIQEDTDIQTFDTFDENEEISVNQYSFDDNSIPVDLVQESSSDSVAEFKPIDYSMFNFAPDVQNEAFDTHDIENKLADLNNQEPDLYILKVFDLKYKQDLSIAKIAELLDTDKQTVITALDKIIELI